MRRAGTRTRETVLARSRGDSGALLEEALSRTLYAHVTPRLLTTRCDTNPMTPLRRKGVHRDCGSHSANSSGRAKPHDRPPELLSTS